MNASRLPRLPVVLTKKGSVAALYSALLQQAVLLRVLMKSADYASFPQRALSLESYSDTVLTIMVQVLFLYRNRFKEISSFY